MNIDVKHKTKIGVFWNFIEKFFLQIVSFVLNIILARLLSPEDYGVIGLLTIFITISQVFVDSGFSRALIQKQNKEEIDFSTTFIFNISTSVILYVILYFASPFIAKFYETPELVNLQRVLFLVIIFNSFFVVQNAKLQIKIDFKSIAIVNSISTILSGGCAIFFAYRGFGPWALVIQTLSKSIFSSLLYWIIGKWVPKTFFSFTSFKQLFSFGSKLLFSGLLSTSVGSLYRLIIGKIYSTEKLGFYTRAVQFPDIVSGTITSVLNTVTFPLMSSLQDSSEDLISTFRRIIKITSMFVFPAMVGLSMLSEPIILVLLGEKWAFAAELLFWLCFAEIFSTHNGLNMNLLNAIGRSDLFLKVDLIKYPFMFLTMAITFPISLKAVVIGRAIVAFVYFYINTYMIGKLYKYGALKQLLDSWKYIISTIIMAIIVKIVDFLIVSNIYSLFSGIIVGGVTYMLCLYILKDSEFYVLITKIKGKIKCKK